jgi:N-acyl-D-aspartate/D-glutamate deacylase
MPGIRLVSTGVLILLAGAHPLVCQERGDIAIVAGRVVDPASGTDRVQNVLIRGERIAVITEEPVSAARTIDATGLVVAPGFVDILARIRTSREPQRYKIMDGVTTVISMHGGPVDIDGWYRSFEAEGSLVNYGTTVGHSDIRAAAGVADRYAPASAEQLARMREIAAEAIDAGAVGIGFGVNYVPGSSYEEIVAMFGVAAQHGVPAHVHSRYKGSVFPETIVQSVQEVIAAAAITGASAQVVHLASSAIGSMASCLNMIEGARRHGIDIMADIHPYLANSTRLESALYDPGWQERFGGVTYDSIMLVETGERLNEETFNYWREKGATIITFFIPEEEMVMALKHPSVMVVSDGVIMRGKGHPRGAGTFSRVLGRLVREEGHLTLMEALRKMTIMPAQRIERAAPSMRYRGRLSVGAYADVTVFDPNSIIDRATYLDPDRYSEGVHYVLVNGTLVVDRGELVEGVAPGRPVRHAE